jgi:hypothetical protein
MVMKLRRHIKRQARAALAGHLSAAACLFLVWALVWGAVSFVDGAVFRLMGYRLEWSGGAGRDWLTGEGAVTSSLVLLVVRMVFLIPLKVGALGWFSALAADKPEPVRELFRPFRSRLWLRSLGAALYTGAVSWGVALAPLGAAGAALWPLRRRLGELPPPAIALLAAVGGVAAMAWLLAARAFAQRYAMVPVLLGPEYGRTVRQAVALSVECTQGHRWRLLWMDLTFLPWFAACLLVAPALYALPYYTASRVCYSRFLYYRRYSSGKE